MTGPLPPTRGGARRGPRRRIHRPSDPQRLYSKAAFPVTGTLTVRYSERNGGRLINTRDKSLVATVQSDKLPDPSCLIEALRTLRQATLALTSAGYSKPVLGVLCTRFGFRVRLTVTVGDTNVEFPDALSAGDGFRGIETGDTPEQWRLAVSYLTRLAVAEATPDDPVCTAAFAAAAGEWRDAVKG